MTVVYQLLRSPRRKTVSIQVKAGEVIVRAPTRAGLAMIDTFVQSRKTWIQRHLQRQQHELERLGVRIEQNGCVPWHGQMLPLVWRRGVSSSVECVAEQMHVALSSRVRRAEPEAVSALLKQWYRRQAEHHLPARAAVLSARTGLVPASVDVGSWRARWGQCSSRAEVTLNWRLLQLRPALQDYVILHELCHVRHMHHGPEFQRLLRHHCHEHPQLRREMTDYTHWLKW
ncbi:hypothetical protein CLV44_11385 [Marinobacterium halophilum]|uniref:YgjP-like metallopeptidase domain-containing protein n=1 Tax=Marinobacterium halophilum TaxID=267374 RepID=A0A2P8EUU9_9GAMM|nr:SprT family zinc-dependent metalloprotease [Marinobacterium halophilum]PSL13247.1 hypothetical protein CLV44_11385 [Marinobacterium halophilum]